MQGLLDNKKDYIKDIQDLISIPIAEKIYSLYNESEGLKSFQKKLINISKWNNHIITEEYENIKNITKYKRFEKLLNIIMITSIKIKIYEYKNTINNIEIKLPYKVSISYYDKYCKKNINNNTDTKLHSMYL